VCNMADTRGLEHDCAENIDGVLTNGGDEIDVDGEVGDALLRRLAAALRPPNETLCRIRLSGCSLSSENATVLLGALATNCSVSLLFLDNGTLPSSPDCGNALVAIIRTNRTIKYLYIDGNDLGAAVTTRIVLALTENQVIELLSLDYYGSVVNEFTDMLLLNYGLKSA